MRRSWLTRKQKPNQTASKVSAHVSLQKSPLASSPNESLCKCGDVVKSQLLARLQCKLETEEEHRPGPRDVGGEEVGAHRVRLPLHAYTYTDRAQERSRIKCQGFLQLALLKWLEDHRSRLSLVTLVDASL